MPSLFSLPSISSFPPSLARASSGSHLPPGGAPRRSGQPLWGLPALLPGRSPEVSGVKGGRRPPRSGRRPLRPEEADRYPRGARRAHRAAASRKKVAAHAASSSFFFSFPAAAYQAASCSAGGMSPIAPWIRWVLNQCR